MATEMLLNMVTSDMTDTAEMINGEGTYLEEMVLRILNNQHTILLVLQDLLTDLNRAREVKP